MLEKLVDAESAVMLLSNAASGSRYERRLTRK
jgi:hypothetical protein